jgi:hypothetical protein
VRLVSAGYSGRPLAGKLGIKPGHRVALDGAPAGFEIEGLPEGLRISRRPGEASYDVVLVFCPDRARLVRRLPALLERVETAGALWIGWPKRASGVPTDLTEDGIREIALPYGVVDVKVCAIDETWSGLKLVRRMSERGRAQG